jgi:hypothetical protein
MKIIWSVNVTFVPSSHKLLILRCSYNENINFDEMLFNLRSDSFLNEIFFVRMNPATIPKSLEISEIYSFSIDDYYVQGKLHSESRMKAGVWASSISPVLSPGTECSTLLSYIHCEFFALSFKTFHIMISCTILAKLDHYHDYRKALIQSSFPQFHRILMISQINHFNFCTVSVVMAWIMKASILKSLVIRTKSYIAKLCIRASLSKTCEWYES